MFMPKLCSVGDNLDHVRQMSACLDLYLRQSPVNVDRQLRVRVIAVAPMAGLALAVLAPGLGLA